MRLFPDGGQNAASIYLTCCVERGGWSELKWIRLTRTARVRAVALWVLPLLLAPVSGTAIGQTGPGEGAGSLDPLVAEAQDLEARIATLRDKIASADTAAKDVEGEDRLVLQEQAWQLRLEGQAAIGALAQNLVRQKKKGLDPGALRARFVADLENGYPNYVRHLDWRLERARALRDERDAATGAEHLALEQRVAEEEQRVQRVYRAVLEAIAYRDMLNLDVEDSRADAARRISERAEMVAGRMRLARREFDTAQAQALDQPDDSEIKQKVTGAEIRLDETVDSLTATIAMMAELDLDTVRYQQLLIQTTGEIGVSLFNKDVVLGLLRDWSDETLQTVRRRGTTWVLRLILFFVVLSAFWVAAALTRRLMMRGVRSGRLGISQLLQETLVTWSSRAVMAIGVLVALSQLGIQIGPLLAGLGIAGFILGFALQETLSNFAAGAMILMYQPFDVGDVVETLGVSGNVSNMSLVSTTILTFDNQALIIPNRKIWGDVIRNVTAQKTRRVDLTVRVDYREDVDRVETVLRDVMTQHEKVLDDPASSVRVTTIGEAGVEIAYRPWCRTEDYWDVYWDLTRSVVERFDREGIPIALPQRAVRLVGEAATAQVATRKDER